MGGSLLLHDDADILDEELLYRAILPDWINKESGEVSSVAFISRIDPHVSVDRSSLTTSSDSLERQPRSVALAQLTAGKVREETTGVASAPIDGNPAHALIIRDPEKSNSAWKKAARRLARACTWALAPRSD